jgi:hypothetical protein
VVITVWHTFCDGNEECAVWLDKLLGEELEHYAVEETNVTRELEKSTRDWATLYMFHIRSNYANPDTRVVALSHMFRERTTTTDRTWRKQGLTVVSVTNRPTSDTSGQSRSTRTQPAHTQSTTGSQRGANTPVLSAAAQASNNARLVTRLSELRTQLSTAIPFAQQAEAAAQAAATDATATGSLEDILPLGNFVDRNAAATATRAAADTAAAAELRIQTDITSTQTEKVNLGIAKRTRFTSSSHGLERLETRMYNNMQR